MLQTTLAGSLLVGGELEQTFLSGGLCSAWPTQSELVMCCTAHQLNRLARKLTKQTLLFYLSSAWLHISMKWWKLTTFENSVPVWM